MSLYNMLFGRNSHSALLLAVLGLREVDVPRFRDVHTEDEGRKIAVYTRMGGGNRGHWDGYEGGGGADCACPGCRAEHVLGRAPGYLYDEDDDFDSTYATYYFATPEAFIADVAALSDPLTNGLRAEFGQHLAKTLRREPTQADLDRAAYDAEAAELARFNHFKANGHTFVPQDDTAMEGALRRAEANGGSLRSCWGILPLQLTVRQDFYPYPKATRSEDRETMRRVELGYEWRIDRAYWRHCQERFVEAYPLAMAGIAESVERHLAHEALGMLAASLAKNPKQEPQRG